MAASEVAMYSKDTCECRCTSVCAFRVLDTIALMAAIGVQGALFNNYFITNFPDHQLWYLLYGADAFMIVIFLIASVLSYRGLLSQFHRHFENMDIPHVDIPMYGILPFGYITWTLYTALLTVKIVLFYQYGLTDGLPRDGWSGGLLSSACYKIIIASASVVFVLLVNTHHDAQPETIRSAYIADLCKGTTFDIMDTVAFLSILLPEYNLPSDYHQTPLTDAIIALGCVNLFLPSLALIKLSLSDFGQTSHPVKMEFLYRIGRLLLIDLPYMIVRIFLWKTDTDQGLSVFLIKNVLYVLISLRYIIPELVGVINRRRRIANGHPIDAATTSAQPSAPDVGIM
ncbi:hypothetical protein CHUAL_004416 [Chamberlinius hualienensis]